MENKKFFSWQYVRDWVYATLKIERYNAIMFRREHLLSPDVNEQKVKICFAIYLGKLLDITPHYAVELDENYPYADVHHMTLKHYAVLHPDMKDEELFNLATDIVAEIHKKLLSSLGLNAQSTQGEG